MRLGVRDLFKMFNISWTYDKWNWKDLDLKRITTVYLNFESTARHPRVSTDIHKRGVVWVNHTLYIKSQTPNSKQRNFEIAPDFEFGVCERENSLSYSHFSAYGSHPQPFYLTPFLTKFLVSITHVMHPAHLIIKLDKIKLKHRNI